VKELQYCGVVDEILPNLDSPNRTDGIINSDDDFVVKFVAGRGSRGKKYIVDVAFPEKVKIHCDMNGVDESCAEFLTGLVGMIQPKIALETGTHRGRSTKAIAEALVINGHGMLWTVDRNDYDVLSRALTPSEFDKVTQVIGETPQAFEEDPLKSLEGIEFAFLDGGHDAFNVMAELEYVDAHRAEECIVAIDNTRDSMWPEQSEFLRSYDRYPIVSLPSMCGTDIIQMR
jgi:predicted O-methyltransferase YrrM